MYNMESPESRLRREAELDLREKPKNTVSSISALKELREARIDTLNKYINDFDLEVLKPFNLGLQSALGTDNNNTAKIFFDCMKKLIEDNQKFQSRAFEKYVDGGKT